MNPVLILWWALKHLLLVLGMTFLETGVHPLKFEYLRIDISDFLCEGKERFF